MSTNALIAVKHTDNKIKSVYVHWDGNTLGPILQSYYNTPELAEELVSHGNISSLGIRIHPIKHHSFDDRESGTTVFYHRDRGEDLKQKTYDDNIGINELKRAESGFYNFIYYFDGVIWTAM